MELKRLVITLVTLAVAIFFALPSSKTSRGLNLKTMAVATKHHADVATNLARHAIQLQSTRSKAFMIIWTGTRFAFTPAIAVLEA